MSERREQNDKVQIGSPKRLCPRGGRLVKGRPLQPARRDMSALPWASCNAGRSAGLGRPRPLPGREEASKQASKPACLPRGRLAGWLEKRRPSAGDGRETTKCKLAGEIGYVRETRAKRQSPNLAREIGYVRELGAKRLSPNWWSRLAGELQIGRAHV